MKKILFAFFIFGLLIPSLYADSTFVPSQASEISTDTSNFDNNLSAADTDVQKALETLDELVGGGGGGDNITVNTTAATNANFLDNIYVDWALDTAATPDDITAKFNYNAASGDIALLANEVAWALNGLVSEGATADTIEGRFAFPDWATSDKVVTFQDATHTVVGRDTTDTLTNKTIDSDNNTLTNIAMSETKLVAGAGLSLSTDTLSTASSEADFLASGALTCGAGTQGKAQVHTTPLQYCDNAATPALQYAAYGNSSGESTAAGNDSVALTTDTTGNYVASVATTAPVTGGAAGSEGATLTIALTQNAGTDVTADLEEETHATEHAVGGADTVFAADPNANATWTWDDTAGASEWGAMSDFSYSGTAWTIGADKILESHLKAVDAAVDEECLTYESTTGDFEWQTCGSGSDTNSVKEYYWPAAALEPLEHTADSIPPISKSAGTNVDALVRVFDSSTDECAGGTFKVPSDVQSGSTITFRVWWYSSSDPLSCGTACEVMWDFRHVPIDDDEAWDAALTTEAAAADSTSTTNGDLMEHTWTETLVNTGWAANDNVLFEVCRDADHASDDLDNDAAMMGFAVEIPRA